CYCVNSERRFVCPVCACVYSDSFSLQEHVELHLDPAQKTQGTRPKQTHYRLSICAVSRRGTSQSKSSECPMCSVVCSNSFTLQEHVELHLDHEASVNASPGSDLKLARRLQEEEEQRRREEEARLEKEQFKKLQKEFGLDGTGGYRKQMEQRLERAVARGLMDPAEFHCKRAEMMESLATGRDDGQTRTRGVLKALSEHFQSEGGDCVHVWLCGDTDHFCSSDGDRGWGCGYRNFQMLLSSLLRLDQYTAVLPDMAVPSLPRVQRLIEEAWSEGLDPHGASHFNHRLQGTRAWIGATEIYSLLTSLRVRARIVDFHQPTGPGDTHPRLFEWVRQYFHRGQNSGRLPPRIIHTKLPPLYLQHQGHSRTVVGLEQRRSGALCLLMLDPGSSSSDVRRVLSPDSVSVALRQMRKFPSGLKHRQYQLVAAEGVLSEQDKQVSL
uniref:Zinc finger-containing ubiquitin peptidase 1 n=1 Tax=Periophthalmus magnuspinnatus TaxID=409849 RepID=A0A3B4A7Y8_9GOBI